MTTPTTAPQDTAAPKPPDKIELCKRRIVEYLKTHDAAHSPWHIIYQELYPEQVSESEFVHALHAVRNPPKQDK